MSFTRPPWSSITVAAFKRSRPSEFMLEPPGLFPLPRRGNRRPLLVFALRVSAISKDVFSRRQIILKFIDLDVHPQPSESVLCRYFALSAAEARLAKGIATGKSLGVLADKTQSLHRRPVRT